MSSQLSEQLIQDSFHSYLKSSLTQARAERLLDADVLSSAEGDLMVTGPALCLYFAALRCTTNPPSVPLPRRQGKSSTMASEPVDLSPENCPQAFRSFLSIWASAVPRIQTLNPESQHDLARVICGLTPLQSQERDNVGGIAADLRAVAIEISQRRTFQDRYAGDLQAALDETGGGGRKTSFVPPPSYDGPPASIQHFGDTLSPTSVSFPRTHSRNSSASSTNSPPYSPRSSREHSRTPSPSFSTPPESPSFLPPDTPALVIIRETLYASLADALSSTPVLHTLLATDPSRAYFAAVSVAILDVALTNVGSENGHVSVIGVMGRPLTLDECPPPLQPFMRELGCIALAAKTLREEDDNTAVQALTHGKPLPDPTIDVVRELLLYGARGRRNSNESGRHSPQGKTLSFANRISALSLSMTRLKAFRERQEEIFAILRSVGVTS